MSPESISDFNTDVDSNQRPDFKVYNNKIMIISYILYLKIFYFYFYFYFYFILFNLYFILIFLLFILFYFILFIIFF